MKDSADASQAHPTGKEISGTIRLIKKVNNKEFGTKRFCIRCNNEPQDSDISLKNNNDSVVIKINHPNWHDIARLDCEIKLPNRPIIPYKIENVSDKHELSFAIKDLVKGKVSPLQNASGNRSVYVTAIDKVGLPSKEKFISNDYRYKSKAELELHYELGGGKQPVSFSTDRKAIVNTTNTIQKFFVTVSDAAVAYYNNNPITSNSEFEVDLTNKTESTVTIKVISEDEATTNTYTITVNKKYTVVLEGTAAKGSDYIVEPANLQNISGTQTIKITPIGNAQLEVKLGNARQNSDPSGSFVISVNKDTRITVNKKYSVVFDGTATEGNDYTVEPESTNLQNISGTQTIKITPIGNAQLEVKLGNARQNSDPSGSFVISVNNEATITVNKKASNVVDGTEQDAWKKLKNLVENQNVSEIFINGEIKAEDGDENIKVNRTLSISGKEQNKASKINANRKCRIFEISSGGNLDLKNLTLENGTSKGNNNNGGAIYCGGGNITMKDCIIENCESEMANGGAIYCKEVSGDFTVRLTNTTITKCKAKKAGGAVASVGGKLIMENCTIGVCQASEKAGAIYAVKDSYTATSSHSIKLSNTKIKNCTASQRNGGAVISDGTIFIIEGSTSFEKKSVVFLESAASIKVSAELTENAPIMRLDIASQVNNTTVVEGYGGYTLKAADVDLFELNPVSFGTGDRLELDGTVIRFKR